MSDELDPTFKEKMLPLITLIVGSAIRMVGVALVAKGITNQTAVDEALPGAVQVLTGSLLYGSSQIWQYFKSKKAVTAEVKKVVWNQVEQTVSQQVTDQVHTQVAVQVPVAVKEELKNEQ